MLASFFVSPSRVVALLVIVVGIVSSAWAQDAPPVKLLAKPPEAKIPPALTHYMGREIAPYMHFAHAGWLVRKTREQEESGALMLKNLGAEPGMTVCDLGCGNGYHTLPIARLVGDKGKVLAVDIQAEMLRMLEAKAKDQKIKNIEVIHGAIYDPRLPKGKVDLVLLVDVYHEFSHPVEMLARIRESLSPKGKIVQVEFRAEDPKVEIRPEHKMTKAQVKKELTANGFKLVKEYDGLPIQHMFFFERDDNWMPQNDPGERKPEGP